MEQLSLFSSESQLFSISRVTRYIQHKLEADQLLQDLWLEGEVSNWKRAASGHIYFTLKDSDASIRCVIWRTQARRLSYLPQADGELVLAHGHVSVYAVGGAYQFYADNLEPVGQGALYAQFQQLKTRLAEEGVFEETLKQPLPRFPQRIGVVTSATGAALRDILTVLRRRYPLGEAILSPTLVQGKAAPQNIIAALNEVTRHAVQLIILARGGGSLEDLWAFNNEQVARAIAQSPIPIVTGIGHETDFTIADFVADKRAPTPSAAAEIATPDITELRQSLLTTQVRLTDQLQQTISMARTELQNQRRALQRSSPQTHIDAHRQQVDGWLQQLNRTMHYHLTMRRNQLDSRSAQLNSLNPEAILNRGYAIVHKDDAVITQAAQLQTGDTLHLKFADGEIAVSVVDEP